MDTRECKIDLTANPYWRSIAEDGFVSASELFDFTPDNTGLSRVQADAARYFLRQLVSGLYKGLAVEEIPIEEFNSSICGAEARYAERKRNRLSESGGRMTVSKGGSSAHGFIINEAKAIIADRYDLGLHNKSREERIKAMLDYKCYVTRRSGAECDVENPEEAYDAECLTGLELINSHYMDNQVLTAAQVREALFEVLKLQLWGKLDPGREAVYREEMGRYVDAKLAALDGPVTFGRLFGSEFYGWVMDFKEEVDIPSGAEAAGDEEVGSIRDAAQGPFSSTCGVYAILSFFESLGYSEELKREYGIRSFSDLDRAAFGLMKPHTSYKSVCFMMRSSLVREQGMSVTEMPELAREIAKGLGIDSKYRFKHIRNSELMAMLHLGFQGKENGNAATEAFFKKHPHGFVATISTEVGPHAVHVLGYDGESGKIRYYDPIGKDGSDNVHEVSPHEFAKMHLSFGDFGLLLVVKKKRP